MLTCLVQQYSGITRPKPVHLPFCLFCEGSDRYLILRESECSFFFLQAIARKRHRNALAHSLIFRENRSCSSMQNLNKMRGFRKDLHMDRSPNKKNKQTKISIDLHCLILNAILQLRIINDVIKESKIVTTRLRKIVTVIDKIVINYTILSNCNCN